MPVLHNKGKRCDRWRSSNTNHAVLSILRIIDKGREIAITTELNFACNTGPTLVKHVRRHVQPCELGLSQAGIIWYYTAMDKS